MNLYPCWNKTYSKVLFGYMEYNSDNRPLFQKIGITHCPTLFVYLDQEKIYEATDCKGIRHVTTILNNWK